MKTLRFLPLLFVCAFAPAVLAQGVDLRASLWMQPTALYNVYDYTTYGWALAEGTLTVINASNVPVQDVVIQANGPLYFHSGQDQGLGQQAVCSSSQCKLPVLAPGSVTLSVAAYFWEVPADGTIETTTAKVWSTRTSDPDMTNNTGSANTTVLFQSDVTIDSLNATPSAAPGGRCAIAAYYSNRGPSPATDLSITISIPPGLRYEGYYAQSRFHCTEPPVGGHGDLVCMLPSIRYIVNDPIEAVVSVDPSLAPGTVLPLNGTLTSTSGLKSPVTASGSLTVAAPAAPDAAVSVAATFDKPSVALFDTVTETFTVSNAGPHDARNVTLDVGLPDDSVPVTLVSATTGQCRVTTMGQFRCTAATLVAGATMKVSVSLQTFGIGTFPITGVVTSLNGGAAAASSDLFVFDPKARRRAAQH